MHTAIALIHRLPIFSIPFLSTATELFLSSLARRTESSCSFREGQQFYNEGTPLTQVACLTLLLGLRCATKMLCGLPCFLAFTTLSAAQAESLRGLNNNSPPSILDVYLNMIPLCIRVAVLPALAPLIKLR